MKAIILLSVLGILMGLGLIIFTAAVRKKLPFWSRIAFSLVGAAAILSGGLMAAGAYLTLAG